ncbi:MAG: hypothetical protein ISP90_04280 [Nevskia sp.]|nr:hypothetical protein [Nevskia sp.]
MGTLRQQQDLYRVTVASYQQDAVFDAVVRRAQESPRRPDVAQTDDGRYRAVVYLRGAALERLRAEEALDIVAAENISARLRGARQRPAVH